MTLAPNLDRPTGQTFSRTLASHGLTLQRSRTEIFQLNVGKLCDLTCVHCHVNAGPKRKEIIARATVDRILDWLVNANISTRQMPQIETIIDRCNLTILLEPGFQWLAEFLFTNRLNIVASMPCYGPENVDAQRGDGVFDLSIRSLQRLNSFGYGRKPDLVLDLVYNPNGDFLPADQAELEADYKRELKKHFDIDFHRLYTITNMPIGRFASWLKHSGKLSAYMELLVEAFNPASVAGLMCRNTLSVGWRGEVYDCDFNQQLGMQWKEATPLYLWDLNPEQLSDGMQWKEATPLYLWDLNPEQLSERSIAVGNHCFGCTAGSGSSCSGALVS